MVKADIVPVGEDQLPMIEQTNEIVRSFNRIYNCHVLVEAKALVPKIARLPGTDGKAKMGKSLGNAIYLSDPSEIVIQKVKSMYTDPNHIKVSDPGRVEGNPVFDYLDAFATDHVEVEKLKEHYKRGGLGDMVLKNRLAEVLEHFLAPIRVRRRELEKDLGYVESVLKAGTEKTLEVAERTIKEVKEVMHINY